MKEAGKGRGFTDGDKYWGEDEQRLERRREYLDRFFSGSSLAVVVER